MNRNVFKLLVLIVTIHFVFGGTHCEENEARKCEPDVKMKEKSNQESEMKNLSQNPHNSHQITTETLSKAKNNENEREEGTERPEYEERQTTNPRYSNPDTERQNLFVSDDTSRYNVHVESVRSSTPPNLNAALGAISAHILNPRTDHDEYIPYPPNGDPYNYLAYRGHPQMTEPPVVRAYEAATNFNYGGRGGGHPTANFGHRVSNGVFPNNDHRQGFHSQFDNFETSFYTNPNIFDQGGFYLTQQRDLEPIFDEKYFFDGGRPIKRFAPGYVQ